MPLPKNLQDLFEDPPPQYAFEISESGIACARTGARSGEDAQIKFEPVPEGVLSISPVHDNVQQPDLFAGHVQNLAANGAGRKRRAALILPDYCVRIAVLDFDTLPSSAQEQNALIRFRFKKTVPFDIDSAVASYFVQPRKSAEAKIEVVAALAPLEIVARYEAPFRAAGFQPGWVTTSLLAALQLVQPDRITVLAKLSGRALGIVVLEESTLKLVRCVPLDSVDEESVTAILHPTMAYIEDELETQASRLLLCGFGAMGEQFAPAWAAEWNVTVEPLRSRFGTPGMADAGLLGYLESVAA